MIVTERYLKLAEEYSHLALKQKKILFSLSLLRLVVFVGGIGLITAGFSYNTLAGSASIIITLVFFFYLLNRFAIYSEKKEYFENLEHINRNEINALITGDLSPFNDGSTWINKDHDFANDVDLFGKDSLFHYLNRTVTGEGRSILADWLSVPDKLSGEIAQRQEAIAELSDRLNWRQEFIAYGTGKSLEKEDILGLLDWLNSKSEFLTSFFWKTVIWLFPSLAIISLILVIPGYIPFTLFSLFFIVNLLLTLGMVRNTAKIQSQVTKKHSYLSSLNRLLLSFDKEPFEAPLLRDIKDNLSAGEGSAVTRIRRLSLIIKYLDTRLNLIVGVVLNGLLLWDFHCLRHLDKWKEESKERFPGWLEQIGKVDALISLGNFAYNNPCYVFPVHADGEVIFSAVTLGHPLIDNQKRICNDFEIQSAGKIIIVTGANMAGKSTFLRTVAVNFILAMVGAPVCAAELKFTPCKLFTSMRTTDSLTQNESYFYAELRRLKRLKIRLEEGEPILFILDEILKGTNSADKSAGSKLFINKLIDLNGTGLIATHDISLGEMENDFPDRIINKCFEIEIDGENIMFDYKLRKGITRKMNAALLMKQMGIA